MAYKPVPYERRAYYYETDQMGFVHHSNYIRWLEEARLDFMRQANLNYADMEKDGLIMPVTGVTSQFITSVHFDEAFRIVAKLIFFNGVRAVYHYETYLSQSGKLAATGESSHCFLDGVKRTPVSVKTRYPDFFERCLALLDEDDR